MNADSATLCRVADIEGDYWAVVGTFVENEANRRGLTLEALARRAGLSRQTVSKLANGQPLQETSLARIEGVLELPRDLLLDIATGNESEIRTAVHQKDPDLYRWLKRKIAEADRVRSTTAVLPTRIPDPQDDAHDVLPDLPAAARAGRIDRPDEHAE